MQRLTHAQLIQRLDDKYDAATSAPWSTRQKVAALNEAYQQWFRERADQVELTSKIRQQLRPLTLTLTRPLPQGTFTLNLRELAPPVYRLLAVIGTWGTRQYPVAPIGFDELAEQALDPFNAPTNRFPRYTESRQEGQSGELLTVKSQTPPLTLTLTYLHEPVAIDAAAPGATTEVDYDAQLDILGRAVALLKLPADDFEGWQATTSQLQATT